MSYIRRALIVSVGVSAGVCTAPHLCTTRRTPTEPSAHYRSSIALGMQSGFHGGCCGRNSAEEGVTGATTEQASVTLVDEALCALFRRANDLLDTTTQALVEGIAMAMAAATVACTHAEAHATTFAHAPASVTRSDIAATHSDDGPPRSSEEDDRVTDSTTDARVGSSAHTQSVLPKKTRSLRTASHKLKDRFMYYARRDPVTGEFVLSLEGFVRCMLLLPDDGGIDAGWLHRYARAKDDSAATTQQNSSKAPSTMCEKSSDYDVANTEGRQMPSQPALPWHHQGLPLSVQRRFADFFQWVDLDGTNSIGYAEFVVLFTFLSIPQETLQRAFRVFDLDGSGRLSELQFCCLLNTIMVDPAVHVRYTDVANGAGGGKKNCTAMLESAGAVSSRMCAPHASTESRTGTRRRGKGFWQRTRDALTFDVGSEMIRPFLFGPLPLHVGAPPDGTLHSDTSTVPSLYPSGAVFNLTTTARSTANNALQAAVSSTDMVSAPSGFGESVWWRRSWHLLQHICRKVWPHRSSSAQPSHHPTSRGGPFSASINAPVTATDSSASLCMSPLQLMAQEDTLLRRVSYPTLLYRLDYMRWELRAIEFGLCDAFNSGVISLDDCRRLLHGNLCSTMERRRSANTPPDAIPVTWNFYKKLFDVMRESDRIMWALQLALDAMPPVPEEMLRGGAIPDEALEAATGTISDMVRLSALRHASSTGGKSMDARSAASPTAAAAAAATAEGVAASQHRGVTNADCTSFNSAGVTTSDSTSGDVLCGTATTCRDGSSSLVRPTALTWNQFNRVLNTIGAVTPLQGSEEFLFLALFDEDGSDSLSPAEFARVCAIKERFFAQKLPRFDEPKRNVVQQFFQCMQQLD